MCQETCPRRTCLEKEPRDHPGRAELAYAREKQPQIPPWKPRETVKWDVTFCASQVST